MRPADWPRDIFHGTYDPTSVTLTITTALALYNCIELLLLIFVTFRQYEGLYFWSITITTFGTMAYGLGLIIEYFSLAALWVGKIIDTAGWMVMVTGQSLVLYSRLGLILANPRILRAVKWMIIVDACLFHGITTIVDWGRYTGDPAYGRGYHYIEYIQMTGFCIQEFIISGLYLWNTAKLLKVISKEGVRRVMWQLFTINIVIIILDVRFSSSLSCNLADFCRLPSSPSSTKTCTSSSKPSKDLCTASSLSSSSPSSGNWSTLFRKTNEAWPMSWAMWRPVSKVRNHHPSFSEPSRRRRSLNR